ncbi:MAG TPA: hypothetical protein VHX36_13270 [Candidatus Acidoferrales bacterium]|jgi:hypothetical protein|nr:hypothetical protein [Candidatus Acidoferrales bacterium]
MNRFAAVIALIVFALAAAAAQQSPPASASPDAVTPVPPSTPAPTQVAPAPNPEFLQAADEVLQQMSQILHLPVLEPLKKSLRSKDQIRAYLISEEANDKDAAQRYADRKALEAFGLIPKDFPLDSFMIQVLTDQVAGFYDPKAKEFYIADWIEPSEQREVMSHELTHALEDQSFHIDPWIKAARPNDDAEMARDAVSEGSAMAAMVDYALRDDKVSVRDLPDITLLMRSSALDEMDKDPNLVKAPVYIRDGLLFPYLAGASFTQQFLKAHDGWPDLKLVFQNPPVSTQQIMHPDLYLKGVMPRKVVLPEWKGLVPADWKLLEENVMGELGLEEILKQFIGAQRADELSPAWTGDRYAVFEDAKTKQTPDVFLLALDTPEHTGTFFGQYSEGLETKYANRTQLFRRPNFFQFQTDQGGVFLWCVELKCLNVERATRETFDAIDHAIGWPPAPAPAGAPASSESAVRLAPVKSSVALRAMLASR